MLNLVGQFGPLLGTRLYPDNDKPFYVKGMSICSAFMFLVAILALILRRLLAKENERWAVDNSRTFGKQEEEGLVNEGRETPLDRFMNML